MALGRFPLLFLGSLRCLQYPQIRLDQEDQLISHQILTQPERKQEQHEKNIKGNKKEKVSILRKSFDIYHFLN